MAGRVVARLVAVVAAAFVISCWVASPASAHASLQSTTPGDGAVVRSPPHVVRATFDESVGVSSDSLQVYGPQGDRVDSGHTTSGGNGSAIEVSLGSSLPDGTYTVAWHVVSADSHPAQGAFTFSIGHPSRHIAANSVEGSGSAPVSVGYAVVRGIGFLGYAVLTGGLVFLAVCWPTGGADRRTGVVLLSAWAVSTVAAVCALLLQGVYAEGRGLSHLLDASLIVETLRDRSGIAVMTRLMMLTVALGLVAVAVRYLGAFDHRGRRVYGVATIALAMALGLTWALADHSSVGRQLPMAILADDVHLTAMACWIGGLAMLLIVTARPRHADSAPGAVRIFSPLAGWYVVLMVVTGTYQSWRNIGHWAALIDTTYGRLVLAKVFGLLVLVILGYNARRIIGHTSVRSRPRADRHGQPTNLEALRRSAALEAVVVLAVLAATAALVNTPTGREAYHPIVTATRPFDTGTRSGTVSVTVRPARLGPQIVAITVRDEQHRPYRPAQLTASLGLPSRSIGPLNLDVHALARGSYRTTPEPVGVAGTWTLSLTVRSDQFDETTVQVLVPIG
jgi:copper transport protein